MWILPRQLISAFAPVMGASTSDCGELSQICGQSLMQRSKPSRASFFSREWKAGRLMRLQSGAISSPSRGQRFLDAWTSSLAVIPASHSQAQASGSEPTTSDTFGHSSQMAFGFFDHDSAFSRTSKDTSVSVYGKSSMSWEAWVTERRGEYSARLKLAHLTRESGCSLWPTAKARDWKDTTGCSLDAVNPDGTHRNRRDRLVGAIAAEMSGPPAQENPSTDGSRRELWPTPDATGANDGVPWEKFHASMMERRAQVKKAVSEGKTKQGSGRSPNLAASVQNPQWATPKAWATPQVQDTGRTAEAYLIAKKKHGSALQASLQIQVKAWATPTAAEAKNQNTSTQVYLQNPQWATPSSSMMAGRSEEMNCRAGREGYGHVGNHLLRQTGNQGKLNPRWVETLMGLPVGWVMPSCASPVTIEPTNSGCSETESSQLPPQELLPF